MLRIPDVLPRIQDPTTATNEEGEQNLLSYYLCSHKYLKKLKIIYFKQLKKNVSQFTKNYRTFYPNKLSLSSQKYGILDPGFEI